MFFRKGDKSERYQFADSIYLQDDKQKLSTWEVRRQFEKINFGNLGRKEKQEFYEPSLLQHGFDFLLAIYHSNTGVVEMFADHQEKGKIYVVDVSPEISLRTIDDNVNPKEKFSHTEYVRRRTRAYLARRPPLKIRFT